MLDQLPSEIIKLIFYYLLYSNQSFINVICKQLSQYHYVYPVYSKLEYSSIP